MTYDGSADKSLLTSLDTDFNPHDTTVSVRDYHDEESSVTSCESNQDLYENKFEKFFERVKDHYKHHF